MSGVIENPNQAFNQDDNAAFHPRVTGVFLNGGTEAIAEGDLVILNAAVSSSVFLEIAIAEDDSNAALLLGAATEAIAVGDTGVVTTHGYAVVNIGDDTPLVGDLVTVHGTTHGAALGVTGLGVAIDAPAAGLVQGDYIGMFLSIEDTVGTDQAAIWVSKC